MGLSCTCDWEHEPGSIGYYSPDDFEIFDRWIGKRCKSCGKIIRLGDYCLRFSMFKTPEYDIEVNIYGEDGEIPRANQFMCEKCGEIFMNLRSLGYCIDLCDNMHDLLGDYQSEKQWELERIKRAYQLVSNTWESINLPEAERQDFTIFVKKILIDSVLFQNNNESDFDFIGRVLEELKTRQLDREINQRKNPFLRWSRHAE